jgi:transcriptional regulator with XRE-family HTH domain
MEKRMAQVCRVLGGNVKTLRLSLGMSQEELAFQAEIDRTYVSQVERGVGNPSVLVLVKLSRILGVEVQELFVKK